MRRGTERERHLRAAIRKSLTSELALNSEDFLKLINALSENRGPYEMLEARVAKLEEELRGVKAGIALRPRSMV